MKTWKRVAAGISAALVVSIAVLAGPGVGAANASRSRWPVPPGPDPTLQLDARVSTGSGISLTLLSHVEVPDKAACLGPNAPSFTHPELFVPVDNSRDFCLRSTSIFHADPWADFNYRIDGGAEGWEIAGHAQVYFNHNRKKNQEHCDILRQGTDKVDPASPYTCTATWRSDDPDNPQPRFLVTKKSASQHKAGSQERDGS